MHTKRLFVGIPLSGTLVKRLVRECDRFRDLPLIFTSPGNLHVTLLFLGFVDESIVGEIAQALETAAERVEPFDIQFSSLVLAPAEHPSMVWLAGETSEDLVRLRNAVVTGLSYRAPDAKQFRPHVTLAKIRRRRFAALANPPVLEKPLRLIEPVAMITLFESTVVNGRRTYVPLEEFPLGGR
jgi:RNA 2',3'-cyclic 3'-phosphodiesterase